MKRLIGGILTAAGILVGGASGICSLVVLVGTAFSLPDSIGMIPLVGMIGGIPMLIGFGLFKWGRKLVRDGDAAGHDELQ